MTNLATGLRELALWRPGDVFITFTGGTADEDVTFGELFARSAGYAATFVNRGVGAGDIVPIILRHGPHQLYAFLGAVLAGAIPAFLPHPNPKQRADLYWTDHQRLFARIEPASIVTYAENARAAETHLADTRIPIIVANDALAHAPADTSTFPGFASGMDTVACLQHSSGTTGLKKGVMLSHRAISRQVDAYARAVGLRSGDRIASWLPLYHDMGFVACFLLPLLRGLRVVTLDPFVWSARPRLLLEAIERHAATFCWLPNFAFVHLANGTRPADTFDLRSLRALINCSEPCRPAAFETFFDRFHGSGIRRERLQTCYALAENVFAVTQTCPGRSVRALRVSDDDGAERAILSSGVPIDGVEIAILDPEGRKRSEGETGEIAIASPFLFDGYYPEGPSHAIAAGHFRTGDIGTIDGGELFVFGRIDDRLTVSGRNVFAHELEDIAGTVAGVIPGRILAYAADSESGDGHELAMIAEAAPGVDARSVSDGIRVAIAERLGLSVRAVQVAAPGSLIKTTSGKLRRAENTRHLVNRPEERTT